MLGKSPDAFRTISEVGDDLDLPQHVLRFWETRFPSIRPLKRGGGRRYYRPDDVDLLRGIRTLLYGQGYTIRGVQRIIKQSGPRAVQAIGRGEPVSGLAPPAEDGEDGAPDLPADEAGGGGSVRVGGPAAEHLRAVRDDLLECRRLLAVARAEQDG